MEMELSDMLVEPWKGLQTPLVGPSRSVWYTLLVHCFAGSEDY